METRKCRRSFLLTLLSMESSSSGVALTAGEMLAPALAEATAVAEAEGEGAGVGDWPNAVQARAIELRQVKIVVFIVSLGVRCVAQPVWIQKTTTWIRLNRAARRKRRNTIAAKESG